jgi:hypothetical protein
LETLRKLLNDQVRITERKNLVLSKQLREALEDAMIRYTNKQLTTAEMITKLLDLARWVRNAQKHGQDLGLTDEETAFYDALAENESAKEVMIRYPAADGARIIGRSEALAQTRLDPSRVCASRSAAPGETPPGEVRLPPGLSGRRHPTGSQTGRTIDERRK